MPSFRKDFTKFADDTFSGILSPVSGPVNAAITEAKDIYRLGKDLFTTPSPSRPFTRSQATPPRLDIKRKFAGDPTSGPPSKKLFKPSSRSISTGSRTMPTAQQNAATANGVDEVPVMPAGIVSKSHPEYFTVNLPFYQNFSMSLQNGETIDHQFIRLDSPYDPIVDGEYSSSRQPLGRDTWAGIYDFYRVIESDVSVKFTYTLGSFGDDSTVTPHVWNGDNPVQLMVGYNITDDVSDVAANPIAFVEMKHSKADYIHPQNMVIEDYTATTSSLSSRPNRAHFNGGSKTLNFHYQPEQWDYHVSNLGLQERWTPKTAVPDFSHYLGIVIAYANNNVGLLSNEYIKVDVDLYVTYKTQWREVNSTKKRTIDAS